MTTSKVPTGRPEFDASEFISDAGQQRKAAQAYLDYDADRALAEEQYDPANYRENGISRSDIINELFDVFHQSIVRPAILADVDAVRKNAQNAQNAWAQMLGMSQAELDAITAAAKVESQAALAELGNERDPAYETNRLKLAKAVKAAKLASTDAPLELAKLMMRKRAEANAKATCRDTLGSRETNNALKLVFSVYNSAMRSVVSGVGRAVAYHQFHNQSFRDEFRYEGKTYSIDKAAGSMPAESTETNPLLGFDSETLYASFEAFKALIEHVNMAMVGLREDARYNMRVILQTPGDYDALQFADMSQSHGGAVTELRYSDYSIESVVEEELLKLKIQFAIEAKASEFLGALDGHASSIDF